MNILKSNKFIQKIIIALCIVILIFNVICPVQSHAFSLKEAVFQPLTGLIKLGLDSVVGLVQYYLVGGPVDSMWVLRASNDKGDELKDLGIIPDSSGNYDDTYIKWGEPQGDTIEVNSGDYGSWFDSLSDFFTGGAGYDIPAIVYTPEALFSNKINAFSIDFISKDDSNKTVGDYKVSKSIASTLRGHISDWYNALRILAGVSMLPILVYIGIRIMISSAGEKAKYKNMLMDWLVAFCLLFVMHYIMAFIVYLTNSITNLVGSATTTYLVSVDGGTQEFKTNLMGLMRFNCEYKDPLTQLPYICVYALLVVFTVIYTWTYLKRTLMIAFLTLIAPIITVTYPLDKLGDGKSQGFDMWFKEYLFNAIIQPFHLLLYIVFAGGSVDLIKNNPIIAIGLLAFMLTAEKILKKMFNFDKASLGAAEGNGMSPLLGGLHALTDLKQLSKLNQISSGKTSGAKASGANNSSKTTILTSSPSFSTPLPIGSNGSGATGTVFGTDTPSQENSDENTDQTQQSSQPDADSPQQGSTQPIESPDGTFDDTSDGNPTMPITSPTSSAIDGDNPSNNGSNKKAVNEARKYMAKRALKSAAKIGGKGLLKVGGAFATAATMVPGAAAGLAIGALSGDPSKAFQMALTGGMVTGTIGRKAGRYTVERIGPGARNAMDAIRDFKDPMNIDKNNEERNKKRAKKAYMDNGENYRKALSMASKLGSPEDAKDIQEKMFELEGYGITDEKDQKRALEMEKNNEDLSLEQAAWGMNKSKSLDVNDDKKMAEWRKGQIQEQMNTGLDRSTAAAYVEQQEYLIRESKIKGEWGRYSKAKKEQEERRRSSQQTSPRPSNNDPHQPGNTTPRTNLPNT